MSQGLKPDSVERLDVRAKARTYLRSNGKGNDNDNENEKGNEKGNDNSKGKGKGKGKGNGNGNDNDNSKEKGDDNGKGNSKDSSNGKDNGKRRSPTGMTTRRMSALVDCRAAEHVCGGADDGAGYAADRDGKSAADAFTQVAEEVLRMGTEDGYADDAAGGEADAEAAERGHAVAGELDAGEGVAWEDSLAFGGGVFAAAGEGLVVDGDEVAGFAAGSR